MKFSSVQFSRSVVSDSLRPHESQHARHPCPLLFPRVCSNSCPLNWCCRQLSRLLLPVSLSTLNLFQHQDFFPVSQICVSGGQRIGGTASASVLPMNIQGWFPLGLTGLISLLSEGLSIVFSSPTVWKHQLFLWLYEPLSFVGKVMSLLFNMLSRFVIALLPRSKRLLTSWLQSLSAVILDPKKIKSVII